MPCSQTIHAWKREASDAVPTPSEKTTRRLTCAAGSLDPENVNSKTHQPYLSTEDDIFRRSHTCLYIQLGAWGYRGERRARTITSPHLTVRTSLASSLEPNHSSSSSSSFFFFLSFSVSPFSFFLRSFLSASETLPSSALMSVSCVSSYGRKDQISQCNHCEDGEGPPRLQLVAPSNVLPTPHHTRPPPA